jgi:universal stress protein A
MSNASKDYRQLLVAVDLGDLTERVVQRGVDLGRRVGAAVDVVNILEGIPGYLKYTVSPDDLRATEANSTCWSQERLTELKTRHPEVHATHTAHGSLAEEVRVLVTRINADLLMVGAHERWGMAVLFGDRSDEILHKAPCDVLVVKDETVGGGASSFAPYRHIIAAVDLGPEGAQVVERAARLAAVHEAQLTLVHVMDHFPVDRSNALIAPEDRDPLAFERDEVGRHLGELATVAGAANSRSEVLVSAGTASREIPAYAAANAVDLIVTGSHGRHGLGRLLGSTADGIRHRAHCDVLVVHVPVAA